jgi:hypothetical protein
VSDTQEEIVEINCNFPKNSLTNPSTFGKKQQQTFSGRGIMVIKKWLAPIAGGLLLCTLFSVTAWAAEDPAPRRERGERQEGQGPRGFDMENFQQRMMERMKEQLSANEDERKVIEPRLSKVITLNRQSAGRFMGGMGRRGGPGGQDRPGRGGPDQDNPVQQAQDKLQQTLENPEADAAQIKSQLTALREAREKNKQELAKAQQELREVLSMRQEAQLVMMGMLD